MWIVSSFISVNQECKKGNTDCCCITINPVTELWYHEKKKTFFLHKTNHTLTSRKKRKEARHDQHWQPKQLCYVQQLPIEPKAGGRNAEETMIVCIVYISQIALWDWFIKVNSHYYKTSCIFVFFRVRLHFYSLLSFIYIVKRFCNNNLLPKTQI